MVAEGREQRVFWTCKSVRDKVFPRFPFFRAKFEKQLGKWGGGPWMDFGTLGPTSVHVLYFVW